MLYTLLLFFLGVHIGLFVANYMAHRLTEPIPMYFKVYSFLLSIFALVVIFVG